MMNASYLSNYLKVFNVDFLKVVPKSILALSMLISEGGAERHTGPSMLIY